MSANSAFLSHDTPSQPSLAGSVLTAWAEASGLGLEARQLVYALQIRDDAQSFQMGTVFDSITHLRAVLNRWQAGGTNTFGLARFASAWQARVRMYDDPKVVHRRIVSFSPIDRDFVTAIGDKVLSLDHDALFLLMQCQLPQGPDHRAHQALRAWALVRGMELASRGVLSDEIFAEVCHVLRKAAYEEFGGKRRSALEPLGAWTATFAELTDHLRRQKPKRGSCDEGVRREILTLLKCAEGLQKPLEPWHVGDGRMGFVLSANPFEAMNQSAWLNEEPAELRSNWASEPLLHGEATNRLVDDSDTDAESTEVDSEAPPQARELHVRAARFMLGSQARFLRWDWAQVCPPELVAFNSLLERSLNRDCDGTDRQLAAICWIAQKTGTSLSDCAQIPLITSVKDVESAEWRLDLDRGHLLRSPPRRAAHFKPDYKQQEQLRAAAALIELPVPAQVVDALRHSRGTRRHTSLVGQLWPDPTQQIESAFRRWVQQDPNTRRLQPGMLDRMLGQRAFEQTRDHVIARLLSATADSALPSSTAYTAYRDIDLAEIWPGLRTVSDDSTAVVNVGGSLLDPNSDHFHVAGFRRARAVIEEHVASGSWIDFHNAVAAYWDAALRAATGARPTSQIWQTPTDIDLDEQFVFVNDKASPVKRSGRLVPLPRALCEHLRHYIEVHVPWVVGEMRKREPLKTNDICVPLFFTLVWSEGRLTPQTIDKKVRETLGVESPLPLNVFRHRLRTRLHREQVDTEIIDSLMGHSDGATATHGDFSMRIWREDVLAVGAVLEDLYAALKVEQPMPWARIDAPTGPSTTPVAFVPRSVRPDNSLKQGRAAIHAIDSFLCGVEESSNKQISTSPAAPGERRRTDRLIERLGSLSEEQLDQLSRKLLTREDGLPDGAGLAKYAFLLRLVETAWERHGQILPMRRQYSLRDSEHSVFTPEAAGAQAKLIAVRRALDVTFQSTPMNVRLSLSTALVLLSIDLCVTSRISNEAVLDCLLEDSDPWRVISVGGHHYLEWSPDGRLGRDPAAACVRYRISTRAAWLLTRALVGKKRRRFAWGMLDKGLEGIAIAAGLNGSARAVTGRALLASVLGVVDQCNAMEFPGTVAGYLAGRVLTASLGWAELVRVRQGFWPDLSSLSDPRVVIETASVPAEAVGQRFADFADDEDCDVAETMPRVRCRPGAPDARARGAFEAVRLIQSSVRRLKEKRGLSKRRLDRAAELSRRLNQYTSSMSSAVHLLCRWGVNLLLRPGGRKLATNSVLRYFGALAPRFLALAIDADLAVMDAEEIEEFYASIMHATRIKRMRDLFVALKAFHRFARQAAGLPEIDWSAVAVTSEIMLGAPGYVDDETYIALLERLGKMQSDQQATSWQRQCFVVFARRFGLRGGEVAGLMRSDVVFQGDAISHVLVQNNRARKLKTSAARRVVPLLADLTPIERQAISRLREAQLEVPDASTSTTPLLSLPRYEERSISDSAMRRLLNAELQLLTGQDGTTLHDLRHTFAAEIWLATQAARWLPDFLALDEGRCERMTGVLLGDSHGPSRRAPWALARLLGHLHPATSLRSYVHFIGEIAETLVDVESAGTPRAIEPTMVRSWRLGTASRHEIPDAPRGAARRVDLCVSSALTAFRHIENGKSDEEIEELVELSRERIAVLRRCGDAVVRQLASQARSGLAIRLAQPGQGRLATGGVPGLLLESAYKRIRDALAGLSEVQRVQLSQIERIDERHWKAMVSDRREISLWEPNHFGLFEFAVRHLVAPGRASLGYHHALPTRFAERFDELETLAIETGWLPADSAVAVPMTDGGALCARLNVMKTVASILLQHSARQIHDRLVLRIDKNDVGHIHSRYELLCCVLCLNAFAKPAKALEAA